MVPIYLLGASMAALGGGCRWRRSRAAISVFRRRPIRWRAGRWWASASTASGLQAADRLDQSDAEVSHRRSREVSLMLLGKLAGVGMGLLMFVVALAIAGIVMAYGESGPPQRGAGRLAHLRSGARDRTLPRLRTATIRAVAQGVVGMLHPMRASLAASSPRAGAPGEEAAGFANRGEVAAPAHECALRGRRSRLPARNALSASGSAPRPQSVQPGSAIRRQASSRACQDGAESTRGERMPPTLGYDSSNKEKAFMLHILRTGSPERQASR